ncbi:nuclear transport factor 2 family protein [Erythrobacter aurantius]|uniref:nuclear transport factor 2 family protein n=1 Tax=Erythrobacter aurantius TaxID=2909249 RepID=UPI00207A495C|nr:nuclear transport factor 2 family protein [Erythrobacter aurantius]
MVNEPDLQQLIGEREVANRLARFARVLDGKQYDAIDQVFAADVTFNYGIGGEQAGIKSMRNMLQQFLGSCGPTQHLIGSYAIEVSGDHATSQAYVQARHQCRNDLGGAIFDTCGDYLDEWAHREHGWRIVRRDVK